MIGERNQANRQDGRRASVRIGQVDAEGNRTLSVGPASQPQYPNDRSQGRSRDRARRGNGSGSGNNRNLDDAAALVLDGLVDDERAVAMRRLRSDPDFRREVRELAPVVAMLPSLLTLPDADRLPSLAGPSAVDGPSPELRSRILAGIADRPGTSVAGRPSERRGERPAQRPPARPGPGSARPVRQFAPPGSTATWPSSRPAGVPPGHPLGRGRFDLRTGANPWLTGVLAAALLVFAVAAIALQVRNARLSDQISDLHAQSTATQNELALANSQSNATAWVLSPTASNTTAAGANGTVFYSYREESLSAQIHGLPKLGDGQVYQLWYLGGKGGETATSAGVMQTDASGTVTFNATGVPRTFQTFAVSVEPAGGSQQPTTAPILVGKLSAAG